MEVLGSRCNLFNDSRYQGMIGQTLICLLNKTSKVSLVFSIYNDKPPCVQTVGGSNRAQVYPVFYMASLIEQSGTIQHKCLAE